MLKDLMYQKTGVFLKPSKKNLIITRLRSRLKELNIDTFDKYHKTLLHPQENSELEYFINSITTNETFFYRNETQFNYLKKEIIPSYIRDKTASGDKTIRIWSGASSTGEEAYTIAMILRQSIPNIDTWKIEIHASDINSDVLKSAREGKYLENKLKVLDRYMKKTFFKKSVDKYNRNVYLLDDKIKSMVRFFQHNLLKPLNINNLDIIFLSNVLIYFDRISKQKVIDNAVKCLSYGGYLFLGQSESLIDIKHNLKFIMPSSFTKVNKK